MGEVFSSSDFGTSTKRRLPICFALDTSGSMMGNPIKQLNMGLQNFLASIKNNDDTRNSTDIAIVTFGSKVEIVMPFGKIAKDQGIPEITASTTLTPIGEGVLTALELLNARKEAISRWVSNTISLGSLLSLTVLRRAPMPCRTWNSPSRPAMNSNQTISSLSSTSV
ncbi:MAG: VWA domain-containing protein [Ruminococcaceae bacterium]|nr:VWA domain-containing protein [Oscillospiraceae bacterium]